MTKRFLMVLLSFLTIGVTAFAVGASVLVKGTHTGAVADLDGNYTVSGVDANSVLVFSSIGYKTQEVVVGNQKNILTLPT